MALVVVAVLVLVALVLVHLARRLDRLHRRVVRSRATLEAQLVHRAEAAADLAASGVLDPAGAVIVAGAAWEAAVRAPRLVGEDGPESDLVPAAGDRERAESELSRALRGALGSAEDRRDLAVDEESRAELERLQTTCYRVQLARRFHNDAVVAARTLRGNPVVRLFRLAGRAPMPVTVELDDDVDPSGATSSSPGPASAPAAPSAP